MRLAATQHGLLRRSQAVLLGLSKNEIAARARSGRWQRIYPSVYRIEGSPRSWHQALRALCLWANRGFALSHGSAAALWGLARFAPGPLEISVTRNLRLAKPVQVHHVRAFRLREITSIEGLHVTSPTRTLLDLSKSENPSTVRASLDELLRRRLTTLERLATAFEGTAHHPGLVTLRQLVLAYQGGEAPTESELEALVLDLIDDAALPRPVKQQRITAAGRLRRLDFAYSGSRIVIEAMGYRWHGQHERWAQDLARANALTARGYRVLHWTWDALHDEPHRLVSELRAMLGERELGLAG